MAQCPEQFDQADCYFNAAKDQFYIASKEAKGTYKSSSLECKKLGGTLAVIDSTQEAEFISGLASNSGSWIGLKRKNNQWKWSGNRETLSTTDPLWATHNKQDVPNYDCAVIDRRGLSSNIHAMNCDANMPYICEFDSSKGPKQCKVQHHHQWG